MITLANLRGVRESGTVFAVPTYGFILFIYLLVLTGLAKCVCGSSLPFKRCHRGHLEP